MILKARHKKARARKFNRITREFVNSIPDVDITYYDRDADKVDAEIIVEWLSEVDDIKRWY